jgi:chromosome segregation ATPase
MEYSDERGSTQSEAIAALLSAAVNTGVNTELTDQLTQINTDLTAEDTELREQTTALQADVNALTAELTRVNAELTDQLTRVNTLDNAANAANDTILQLENDNRELTERVNTLALGVNNLENDLSSGANVRRKIGEYRWKMLRYLSS